MRENYFHSDAPLAGKGLPAGDAWTPARLAARDLSILDEQISLPVAVLSESALRHNLAWMREFTEAYGCRLAPHGKTTMSPALFRMQLDAGAWGITLATAPQTVAAHAHGVRRVLLANQLVGKGNFDLIADLQTRDPDFWFACVVDSADDVAALGGHFGTRGQRIRVLLEIGAHGGRTGVRDEAQARAVLDEIARWPDAVALVGVEVYEGVVKDEAGVRALLRRTLAQWQAIHAANPVAQRMGRGLLPALRLWACVQSRPEPDRAIIGLGKRDAAFDAGFPQPVLHHRPGDAVPADAPSHWRVGAMMDQHAFLQIEAGDDLKVGDLLCFDISHPCLTFDKWRHLLVVDDAHRVVGAVETHF